MISINADTCITIPEHVWIITCWHLHLHTVHPIKVLTVVAGSALVLDPEKALLASTTNPVPVLILITVVLRHTLIQHITPLKPHCTTKYHQLTPHTIPLMLHRTWSTNSCGNGVCAHHTSTIYTIKLWVVRAEQILLIHLLTLPISHNVPILAFTPVTVPVLILQAVLHVLAFIVHPDEWASAFAYSGIWVIDLVSVGAG